MSISNGNLVISRAAMCHRGSFIESWLCKILILILMLATAMSSHGQTTSYYQTTQDYDLGDGVVYHSDSEYLSFVDLYNTANKYHNVPRTYADGRPFTLMGMESLLNPTFSMPSGMHDKTLPLLMAVFTPEQKALLKGAGIRVYMEMDSNTGRVLEVEFRFSAFEGKRGALIPPSTFRALELVLKNNDIYVTPTPLGRSLSRLGATIELRF